MSLKEKQLLLNYCKTECEKIKTVPEEHRASAMIGEYKAVFDKCFQEEMNSYQRMPEIR